MTARATLATIAVARIRVGNGARSIARRFALARRSGSRRRWWRRWRADRRGCTRDGDGSVRRHDIFIAPLAVSMFEAAGGALKVGWLAPKAGIRTERTRRFPRDKLRGGIACNLGSLFSVFANLGTFVKLALHVVILLQRERRHFYRFVRLFDAKLATFYQLDL